MRTFFRLLRGSVLGAFDDGALGIAKGATYSFLLALFPGLLLLAALLAGAHPRQLLFVAFGPVLNRILPLPALHLLQTTVTAGHAASLRLMLSAGVVSLWAASSLMVSWMEAFQKAYDAPPLPLIRQRLVALWLAVAAVLPLVLATMLVAVGDALEQWLLRFGYGRVILLLVSDVSRWLIAIIATTVVLAVVYHQGVARRVSWRHVFPGAMVATGLWLSATFGFAIYVHRFAEYSDLYGGLAAVVILMIWMYILSLVVMIGAEFNSELERHRYTRA